MPWGHALAARLPDIPRWVEARALLLWSCCEIYGLAEEPEFSFVLRDPGTGSVIVIGRPALGAVEGAIKRMSRGSNLLAPMDQARWLAAALPSWSCSRAILHALQDAQHLPRASQEPEHPEVRFLDPGTLDQLPIPEELVRDLELGAESSLIAATFVDNAPVAFCFAGAMTESLWDISIDTLPDHRRRGYAGLCVAHLIRHLQAEGREPVWAAVAENRASRRLAQKLGFVAVDELALFEPTLS